MFTIIYLKGFVNEKLIARSDIFVLFVIKNTNMCMGYLKKN